MHPKFTHIEVMCEQCGETFVAPRCNANKRRHCSRVCLDAHNREIAIARIPDRFWSRVDQSGGPEACWPWQGARAGEYGRFSIRTPDGKKSALAHRMALILSGVDLPSPLYACHHCDNPVCCNPSHLYAGTNRQNTQDAIDRGRIEARLTEEAVLEARRRYQPYKVTYQMLAEEYGCHLVTMRDAIVGRTWQHLPGAAGLDPVRTQLTEPMVVEIRRRYAQGNVSQSALAREYGLSSRHVSSIVRHLNWTHLPSVDDLRE